MEGLHNLKDRICSFENLMGAYRDAAKGKRYRQEVLSFGFNLSENLLSIQRDLLDMTYEVGRYREFYVRYPKPRLVMALAFRDRIVQWAIYRQLNPYLDKRYIEDSFGCRKEKGTHAAAERIFRWQQQISRKPDAGEWYLVKCDISKYFYRVNHAIIQNDYREISDEAWFSWLIDTIINNDEVPFGLPTGMKPNDCPRSERLYEIGMPIGNLTSQETANLYLDKLDKYCKHVLNLHFYDRYMDDFGIFIKGKDKARDVFSKISEYAKAELLLDMSPKCKIQKAIAPFEFVGFRITPHGVRMRKKTTRHMKNGLHHIMDGYASGKISFKKAMESVICYVGICKKCNGYYMIRWIEDNFVLRLNSYKAETSSPGEERYFSIRKDEDGTVDVILRTESAGHDISVRVIRGVKSYDGLEEDIRKRYDAWCE